MTPVIGATPGYTSVQAPHTLQDGAQGPARLRCDATLWSDLFQSRRRSSGPAARPIRWRPTSGAAFAPWLPAPTVGWVEGDVGQSGSVRVGLDQYAQTLERLVRETRALGARAVVLILPAPADLDLEPAPSRIRAYRAPWWTSPIVTV